MPRKSEGVMVGVGVDFAYIAGNIKRVLEWMQKVI